MQKLDQNKIKDFYNNVSNVWGENDPWHEYSQKIISSYIDKQNFFKDSLVLNAGSAGNDYNIDCRKMYHVDIAYEKIKGVENSFVANIENMPFSDKFFDNILCVGSVLNYCDATASISEFARVLKPNGSLILEYESSWGYEYIGKECYKKDACIITTEYIEKQHVQWLYAPLYILSILNSCGFTVNDSYPFHILDGIFSKFMSDGLAVSCTRLDKFIKKIPLLKNHGNNILLCCTKK